jgi:hypothetical protein
MNATAHPTPVGPGDDVPATPDSRPAQPAATAAGPGTTVTTSPGDQWSEVADDDDEYEPL